MKQLHVYVPAETDELAWPQESSGYSTESPAKSFITDFKLIKPLVVESQTSVDTVKALMLSAHTDLISVLNNQGHFLGIIGSEEITDQEILKKLAQGFERTEICVTDMMIKKKDVFAFDVSEIESASISDVIASLKQSGQKYGLVLERHIHQIRGIFSVHEISRKLDRGIDIQEPGDFYRVFAPVSLASR